MLTIPPSVKLWYAPDPVDFRLGFDGLFALVRSRLAADPRLGLTAEQLDALVAEPITFTGAAVAQTREVVRRVAEAVDRHPDAAAYTPGAIL